MTHCGHSNNSERNIPGPRTSPPKQAGHDKTGKPPHKLHSLLHTILQKEDDADAHPVNDIDAVIGVDKVGCSSQVVSDLNEHLGVTSSC